jgi:hypothetical protein
MNKNFLYIGIVAIVFIVAGINVTLNNSANFGGSLSLSNIEALGDGECNSCNYTLVPKECYNAGDICENTSMDRGLHMSECANTRLFSAKILLICFDNGLETSVKILL